MFSYMSCIRMDQIEDRISWIAFIIGIITKVIIITVYIIASIIASSVVTVYIFTFYKINKFTYILSY